MHPIRTLQAKRGYIKKCNPLNLLVRPARFERAAYGFEVRRSIQLSYGRITELSMAQFRAIGYWILVIGKNRNYWILSASIGADADSGSQYLIPNTKLRLHWGFKWGEWWDLNPRQPGPQPGALPPELHPPCFDCGMRILDFGFKNSDY